MMLIEETAVPLAALPVNEFKSHLRLGTGFSDGDVQDVLLESFLRSAIAAIEARTGKILILRSFSWTLTRWRETDVQALPVAPVNEITSLVLRDRIDEEETIDPSFYWLEADTQRPVLHAAGSCFPAISQGGVAEIKFDAGYAPDWGALPSDLAQAVLLLAAHYYEYRHETRLGDTNMPFGVSNLIERYRTVRLFAGGSS